MGPRSETSHQALICSMHPSNFFLWSKFEQMWIWWIKILFFLFIIQLYNIIFIIYFPFCSSVFFMSCLCSCSDQLSNGSRGQGTLGFWALYFSIDQDVNMGPLMELSDQLIIIPTYAIKIRTVCLINGPLDLIGII